MKDLVHFIIINLASGKTEILDTDGMAMWLKNPGNLEKNALSKAAETLKNINDAEWAAIGKESEDSHWDQELETEINEIALDGRYNETIMKLNKRNPKFHSPTNGLQRLFKGQMNEIILQNRMIKIGKNCDERAKWMAQWGIGMDNFTASICYSEGRLNGTKHEKYIEIMELLTETTKSIRENNMKIEAAMEMTKDIKPENRTILLAASILSVSGVKATKWTKNEWELTDAILQGKEQPTRTANGLKIKQEGNGAK